MSFDQNPTNPIEKIHSLEDNQTQESIVNKLKQEQLNKDLMGVLATQQDYEEAILEKNNIINFNQAVRNRQKLKDDELRKYVLNNTVRFISFPSEFQYVRATCRDWCHAGQNRRAAVWCRESLSAPD